MLMDYAIESGMLGNSEVRALDGLSASGLRARRWLNELPSETASRLIATVGDMNQNALDWAMKTEADFPSNNGELNSLLGDLRASVISQGWHWVDIDPFGSPVPFLDTAIQSLARRGVLEVSATDTAALTGSSKNPLMRRYGARVRLDKLKHDSGLRVLMATVARATARHDRSIIPLLSIWDSHHLRVSVRVLRLMEGANNLESSLGWRVYNPTEEEVEASTNSGLLPKDSSTDLPIRCFLPLSHPVAREDKRISGPMWIGPMGDKDVMASMTVDRSLELCGAIYSEKDPANWSQKNVELENRKVARAVRNIAEESEAIYSHHLIAVDELASWHEKGSPPSPAKMVAYLKEKGHSASVSHYAEPSFRTDAPWSVVVAAIDAIGSAANDR
jgi:tRNA (guanine26-N2/guanine27-N2)-dimethyltransferase